MQYYQLRETHHDDSKEHKELLIGEKSKDQGLNPKEGSTKDHPAQPNPSAHRLSVIKRRVPFPTTEAGDQAVQDGKQKIIRRRHIRNKLFSLLLSTSQLS